MKPMLAAFLAIAIIAIGANYALDYIGFSSADRMASENVRLD